MALSSLIKHQEKIQRRSGHVDTLQRDFPFHVRKHVFEFVVAHVWLVSMLLKIQVDYSSSF